MSAPAGIEMTAFPRLSGHMRLRHDRVRDQWTIQAPERSFVLDGIAHAIVMRCTGTASLSAIIDDLCTAFPGAPRAVIERDVVALVRDFMDKGVMAA